MRTTAGWLARGKPSRTGWVDPARNGSASQRTASDMLLTLDGVVTAGNTQHSHRLAVPAGHAVSILNAVPEGAAARPIVGPESAACLERQAEDITGQFERFCVRHAFDPRDCRALTLFVDRADDIQRAALLGKALCAGTRTTVIARLDDPRWRITLNAYFLKRTEPRSES